MGFFYYVYHHICYVCTLISGVYCLEKTYVVIVKLLPLTVSRLIAVLSK